MKETFPDKKRGEHLHHENDWNKIARTVQRLANQLPGTNLSSIHMGSFSGTIGHNPWNQFVATISSTKIDEEDTDDSGLYFCKIRFYDHTETGDEKWKSREKEWLLDASDLGATLIVDDKLAVWWNQQRRAFVPCAIPTIIPIMLKTSIEPNGTADAFPLLPINDDDEIINEEWIIEVEDTIGDKRAKGKDDVEEGSGEGAKGFVKLLTDGTWAIIELQCQAKLIKGTCEATDADATYTLTSITVLDDGQTPADGGGELENVLNYSEDMGAGIAVCVHNGSGGYRTLDGPCA